MHPPVAPASPPAPAARLSPRRRWLFRGIALALPLALLALLEGALRLAGYGHDLRLFVTDAEHPAYWVMNPYASRRYFTQAENAPVGNFEPFLKRKAPGTFRVFVLGESTTIGYPYMHNGSFHRWLQYRLLHALPQRNVEVINLAMTAVNSYTALGFAEELVDYAPDAVLVYVGHNEYYGALGVGSTSRLGSRPGLVRWLAQRRGLRLVQALGQGLAAARAALGGARVDTRATLMQRMAADQRIAYGSAAYAHGLRQFDDNLGRLCALLSSRRVPVFVSTLVGNEKDLPPFVSAPGPPAASAAAQYRRAAASYRRGQFGAAQHQYAAAKELDLLRFRAPEAMNRIIRALPARYPGVFVVDAERRFRQQSPHGILGRELLLEHVHPTLHGYALLSDAFYQALQRQHLWAAPAHEMSFAELEQQMPVTAVDSLKGAYEVAVLRQGWPFAAPRAAALRPGPSVEEQLAGALLTKKLTWNEAMERLMNHYLRAKDARGALRVAEAVMLEYPYDPTFYRYAANFSAAVSRPEQAVLYLQKAFQLQPSAALAQQLFVLHLRLDQPTQALPYVAYARARAGNPGPLAGLHNLLTRIVAQRAALRADSTNQQLLNGLAEAYRTLGNEAVAARYARRAGLGRQYSSRTVFSSALPNKQ